jgi:hypothetical protein
MPPRHAYWTIIVDDQPTSFRAHDVEELLPTFNRLREKHPSAQLKWFERGQLFETRDAARQQGFGQGERRWEGPRPSAPPGERDERPEPRRDAKWRPGGEHRDPRQKYKDAKKAKWQKFKQNVRSRWEEKQSPDRDRPIPDDGEYTPPHGDPIRDKVARTERDAEPRRERRDLGAPAGAPPDRGPRPEWRRDDRRRDDRRGEWKGSESRGAPQRDDRGDGWRPRDDDRGDRKPWGGKPSGPRTPWGAKPGGPRKPWGAKPGGPRKPWGSKPSSGGPPQGDSRGPRKPWGAKPAGGGFRKKPFGSGPPRGPRGPKKRRDDE